MANAGSRVKGQKALVTGASMGIGRAVAVGLAREGAAVVGINYSSSEDQARETAKLVEAEGARAVLLRADVSDEQQAQRMVEQFIGEAGAIDILVNNAGTLVKRHSIEGMPTELWRRVFAVNLDGVFFVTRAAITHMKERGGNIVNITSVAAYTGGGPGSVHYAATKGGLATLTIGLAKELAAYGIRVNAVAPGPIDTPFHERFTPEEHRQSFVESTLLRRFGTPEEVAAAVLFLVSDESSYITGSTIDVNGGMFFRL
ncbi:MAG: SDR family oxidoreductase [Calditrichaeota bacterium]|nr:SDR family oxidoreductase [Calditrichota bacterium]